MAAAVAAGWAPRALLSAYLAGGARLIQLRAKLLDSRAFLSLATACAADARAAGAALLINDRVDIAVLAGAAGVHVGQDDLAPRDVRRLLGPDALIGYSTHTDAQIDDALSEPVSYLAIGPVFGTASKETGYAALGLEAVRRAARRAAIQGMPVVAIGGITLETAPAVVAAGAQSVAVISDLLTRQPDLRVREYLSELR